MRVSELIDLLRKFPQDAEVVAYDASEDSSVLTEDGLSYEEMDYWDSKAGEWAGKRKVVSIIGSC